MLPEVKIGNYDQPIWYASKKDKYSCSDPWEAIQVKLLCVKWWQLIWFPMAIPCQAFILWLVARHNLSTKEKLVKWGYSGDVLCRFCRSCLEGRGHIFFFNVALVGGYGEIMSKNMIDIPYINEMTLLNGELGS